ncbi:hypothetical protein BDZ89DRAFT_1157094 [Hymenopellis radicata]|nr:hypothetical protein BDZ89DRAFT_1157094 [Hymenopellis radicata]
MSADDNSTRISFSDVDVPATPMECDGSNSAGPYSSAIRMEEPSSSVHPEICEDGAELSDFVNELDDDDDDNATTPNPPPPKQKPGPKPKKWHLGNASESSIQRGATLFPPQPGQRVAAMFGPAASQTVDAGLGLDGSSSCPTVDRPDNIPSSSPPRPELEENESYIIPPQTSAIIDEDEGDAEDDEDDGSYDYETLHPGDEASSQACLPPSWVMKVFEKHLATIKGLAKGSSIYDVWQSMWAPSPSTFFLMQNPKNTPTDLYNPRFFYWDPLLLDDAICQGGSDIVSLTTQILTGLMWNGSVAGSTLSFGEGTIMSISDSSTRQPPPPRTRKSKDAANSTPLKPTQLQHSPPRRHPQPLLGILTDARREHRDEEGDEYAPPSSSTLLNSTLLKHVASSTPVSVCTRGEEAAE